MKREELTDRLEAMRVVCYYNTFAAQWNSLELDHQFGIAEFSPCSDAECFQIISSHCTQVRGPLFSIKARGVWYSIEAPLRWTVFADDQKFPFHRNFIPFPPLPRVWRYAIALVGRRS